MTAKYRFYCGYCGFRGTGSFGIERNTYYSTVPKYCRRCRRVDTYKIANLPGLADELHCKGCQSDNFLQDWNGVSCPVCSKHMRSIGKDVDENRSDWLPKNFKFGRE